MTDPDRMSRAGGMDEVMAAVDAFVQHKEMCERQCECRTADEFDECMEPEKAVEQEVARLVLRELHRCLNGPHKTHDGICDDCERIEYWRALAGEQEPAR